MERPSQTYYCQNLGCPNGHGSPFQKAPSDWWAQKGLPLPRNCPDCKEWKDSQADERIRCLQCQRTIPIAANYKKSYHKSVGRYSPPEKCSSCERGVKPRTGTKPRPPSRAMKHKAQLVLELPSSRPLGVYPLETDLSAYQHRLRHGETRQEHIERHTTWSPHSMVDGNKSPTALGTQEPSVEALLRSADIVSRSQNSDRIAEYRAKNGYIVRVTLTDSEQLEVTIINHRQRRNGQHELVTTYDGYTIEKVHSKLRSGDWG